MQVKQSMKCLIYLFLFRGLLLQHSRLLPIQGELEKLDGLRTIFFGGNHLVTLRWKNRVMSQSQYPEDVF